MLDRKRVFDDLFDTFCMLSGEKFVSLYDAQSQVTHWAPGAVKLFGLPGEYFDQGAYNWEDSIHPEDRGGYRDCMTKLLMGKVSSYDISYRVRTANGDYTICRNVGGIIRGENGMPNFIGGNVIGGGIVERTCPLTGLGNGKAYEEAKAVDPEHAHVIKLMRFEEINDSYGYSFGSRFLRKFADRLVELVGDEKAVFRIHGATFGICKEGMDQEAFDTFFKTMKEELAGRFVVDGVIHRVEVTGE